MKNILSIAALLIAFSFTTSCDRFKKKKDDDKGDNGSLMLSGPESIVGNWEGGYRSLTDEGKPLGDVRPAKIFFSTSDEASEFKLQLTDDMSAQVSGEWHWFENKKIFLQVKKSTISRLPESSALLDSDYELTGNSLHIKGETFEIMVSRKNETPGTSDKTAFGVGIWSCTQNEITTRLNIAQDYNWKATISQEGRRSVALSGVGVRTSEDELHLKISTASESVPSDSYLKLIVSENQAALASVFSNRSDDLGVCMIE